VICDSYSSTKIEAESPPPLELPPQWLVVGDMIDEFIYQFQEFCQYRAKLKKSNEQINKLKANPQVTEFNSESENE
jgi:translation initiation factor 3 subunit L